MSDDLIKRATDSLWCATGRPWRLVQTNDYRYMIDADGVVVAEGIALGNAQFLVDSRKLMPELIEALKVAEETARRYRGALEQIAAWGDSVEVRIARSALSASPTREEGP